MQPCRLTGLCDGRVAKARPSVGEGYLWLIQVVGIVVFVVVLLILLLLVSVSGGC
jgi:hypothetical protein